MQTDLLYMHGLERGYDTTFEGRVIMAKPEYVVLDRTLFYPLGGGQDWDTGVLRPTGEAADRLGDGQVARQGGDPGAGPGCAVAGEDMAALARRVTEVTKRGPVKHVVGQEHGLVEGDTVVGTIDWDRRYAHMRMHTAQHLMSGLAYELFGGAGRTPPRTVGNQLHADRSRIDLNPIDLTPEMMSDLETAANDLIRGAYDITATTMTRDEVNALMPEDRTNMDLLPRSVQELRIIRIGEDIDLCPCAGTHVRNTKEIGDVQVLGRKSKGKGTQRLEYTLAGLGDG